MASSVTEKPCAQGGGQGTPSVGGVGGGGGGGGGGGNQQQDGTPFHTSQRLTRHVQIAVGFIQHKHLQLAGIKARRLVHVLEQAAGRAHEDVHACGGEQQGEVAG